MTDVGTLFARILDQLSEMGLRVAELEADLTVERERRVNAERQLQAKIEDEAEEKFNAYIENVAIINQLERRVGQVELDQINPPPRRGRMVLIPVATIDYQGDSP